MYVHCTAHVTGILWKDKFEIYVEKVKIKHIFVTAVDTSILYKNHIIVL